MRIFLALILLALICSLFSIQYVNAATSADYSYDPAGRLILADYGDGLVITYSYDANGNLLGRTVPELALTTAVSPTDGGSVTGDDVSCPEDCSAPYGYGTPVQLTANPATSFSFLGWGGDLSGTGNPGTVAMFANRTVRAYFGADSGYTDTDGLSDAEESGPDGDNPGYDGDGNGVPDYQEARAASLHTATGGGYATVAVPTGLALKDVRSIAVADVASESLSRGIGRGVPEGVTFPYGLFAFTVTGLEDGGCVAATLHLPRDADLNSYWKYGPIPEDPTDHWYEFRPQGQTGAQIVHADDQTTVLLNLCDGLRGDGDAIPGEITDPGGPGKEAGKYGSLRVSIEPARAVAAGVGWRRVGTSAWLGSEVVETGLEPGEYDVEFRTISGWVAPDNVSVTIVADETAESSVIYPEPIPTLSEWGVMILSLLLLIAGSWTFNSRQRLSRPRR